VSPRVVSSRELFIYICVCRVRAGPCIPFSALTGRGGAVGEARTARFVPPLQVRQVREHLSARPTPTPPIHQPRRECGPRRRR
jgi:hypothetical protein